ncbi:hypothetical protein O181_010579 [Austropuccinia psidii MF-1]|uniref:Uncharacterized protein n=1 Tax=Austropuccinia psidii MF-1 TaxID=1389203 RepID=A0A9Q3BRB7_9BASI|nr:hypothetical protein [Austropuccinia psidii MF-1]
MENSIAQNAALFQEQWEKSDKERYEFKEDIPSSIENISLKDELPRQSTQIVDRNLFNLNNNDSHHHTNSRNAEVEIKFKCKDIPLLEQWPPFSGYVEYNHMEFIETGDMLKEDFIIQDEYISSRLH